MVIAAFATQGLCHAVFELCLDRLDIVLSKAILQETSVHLNGKIKLPPAQCDAIISYLRANAFISEIDKIDDQVASICRDKNDLHVLDLARYVSADYIVTGNKDLLEMGQYRNTKIVTPRELWMQLRLDLLPSAI